MASIGSTVTSKGTEPLACKWSFLTFLGGVGGPEGGPHFRSSRVLHHSSLEVVSGGSLQLRQGGACVEGDPDRTGELVIGAVQRVLEDTPTLTQGAGTGGKGHTTLGRQGEPELIFRVCV